MINQELQHQIEIMKAQKHIELSGSVEEVGNFIQALSRIYELSADVAEMEKKLDRLWTFEEDS